MTRFTEYGEADKPLDFKEKTNKRIGLAILEINRKKSLQIDSTTDGIKRIYDKLVADGHINTTMNICFLKNAGLRKYIEENFSKEADTTDEDSAKWAAIEEAVDKHAEEMERKVAQPEYMYWENSKFLEFIKTEITKHVNDKNPEEREERHLNPTLINFVANELFRYYKEQIQEIYTYYSTTTPDQIFPINFLPDRTGNYVQVQIQTKYFEQFKVALIDDFEELISSNQGTTNRYYFEAIRRRIKEIGNTEKGHQDNANKTGRNDWMRSYDNY